MFKRTDNLLYQQIIRNTFVCSKSKYSFALRTIFLLYLLFALLLQHTNG